MDFIGKVIPRTKITRVQNRRSNRCRRCARIWCLAGPNCVPFGAFGTRGAESILMHVHPRRAPPQHPLPLRPARRTRPADRPAAARAALPHAHPQLFAQGRAGEAFHQLAAGSAGQLPRASRLPGQDARSCASRWTWSPRWRCSIRSTSSSNRTRRHFRSPTRTRTQRELAPYLGHAAAARRCSRNTCARFRREPQAHHRFPRRAQPSGSRRTSNTSSAWNPACRRRRTRCASDPARAAIPRGCCAAAAAPGPRRALRQRLPHPAHRRREIARRPVGAGEGFHRPARVVRSLSARRAAGSDSIPPPACSRAKATFRSPARPSPSAPRRSAARWTSAKCEFSIEMKVTRIYESPRVTKPYTEEQWTEIEKLGHAIDADLQTGDVRLTMGGEPTFVSIDDPDGAGVEHHRHRAQEAPSLRRTLSSGCTEKFAPGPVALRPGQVVSGRTAAALGARLLLAQGRRADLDRTRRSSPTSRRITASRREGRGRCSRRRRRAARALRPNTCLPAYEDAFYYLWKERRLPSNVTPDKSNLEEQAGARPHRAHFPAGPRRRRRLRAARSRDVVAARAG